MNSDGKVHCNAKLYTEVPQVKQGLKSLHSGFRKESL